MLLEEDAELFDQLFYSLLNFVNKVYRICPELEVVDQDTDVWAAKAIADYLWSHTRIIDAYLSETELPDEHVQIVAGWKQCKPGSYIVARHLKKGSVFISQEDYKVYMVESAYSTWEETVGKTPVLVVAVLLPFRDSIISDGIVVPYPDYLERGNGERFKRIYMKAKENNTLLFSLSNKKSEYHPRKKETGTVESYIIKVGLEANCYRHIRIGKQETLSTLSEAILGAFNFDNDHCYAFFMDDRYRSKTNAYYCDYMEEDCASSCKVTLRQLMLRKGDKFKYLFDFGDEWRFQCQVMQELEEKTNAPRVIKSVGEAPEQYPSWDDDEE